MVTDYLKQAYLNERLVLFISENVSRQPFSDWQFVVIYYTALHYLYSFLSKRGDQIPDRHKGNDFEEGDVDKAGNILYMDNYGIAESASEDYEQLYNWSCDVRYKTFRGRRLLGTRDLDVAFQILKRIQLIVFSELGYILKFFINAKGKVIVKDKKTLSEKRVKWQ